MEKCKSYNKVIAEYTLRNLKSPIGVSEYKFFQKMSADMKKCLPSLKEIENEFKVRLSFNSCEGFSFGF